MNFIPFIALFVTIIALAWTSLTHSFLSTKIVAKGVIGHLAALEDARGKIEKRYFDKATEVKKPTSGNKKGDEADEEEPSSRDDREYNSSRINPTVESSKLFLCQKNDPKIVETLRNLLIVLYQGAPFFHKETPGQIIDRLLPIISAEFEPSDLIFEEAGLQEAWYQMIQGGDYPSLLKFVAFSNDQKPIFAKHASKTLLTAFLGEEATKEILSQEEAKYYAASNKHSPLNETEMTKVLSDHNLSQLKKYLSFSRSDKVKTVIEGKDDDLTVVVTLHEEEGPALKPQTTENSKALEINLAPSTN